MKIKLLSLWLILSLGITSSKIWAGEVSPLLAKFSEPFILDTPQLDERFKLPANAGNQLKARHRALIQKNSALAKTVKTLKAAIDVAWNDVSKDDLGKIRNHLDQYDSDLTELMDAESAYLQLLSDPTQQAEQDSNRLSKKTD